MSCVAKLCSASVSALSLAFRKQILALRLEVILFLLKVSNNCLIESSSLDDVQCCLVHKS